MTTFITFKSKFSAAHFYEQKKWSKEKNKRIFGKCYSQYGHGHDYKVELAVPTCMKQVTTLEKKLNALCEKLDHKHLNFCFKKFQSTVPTTENITQYIYEKLSLKSVPQFTLRVYERPDLFVEFNKK